MSPFEIEYLEKNSHRLRDDRLELLNRMKNMLCKDYASVIMHGSDITADGVWWAIRQAHAVSPSREYCEKFCKIFDEIKEYFLYQTFTVINGEVMDEKDNWIPYHEVIVGYDCHDVHERVYKYSRNVANLQIIKTNRKDFKDECKELSKIR